jgi:hypothetical protein
MPELPEVELVAKSLDKLVSRRKIALAELVRERLAPETGPVEFAAGLKGSTINFVHRRGKHLLIDLDNRKTLLVHLRMTGRFLLLPIDRELPKHSHAVFYFADESRLIFQDQRHFGLMKLLDTENLFKAKELEKLAIRQRFAGSVTFMLRKQCSWPKSIRKERPTSSRPEKFRSCSKRSARFWPNRLLTARRLTSTRKISTAVITEEITKTTGASMIEKASRVGFVKRRSGESSRAGVPLFSARNVKIESEPDRSVNCRRTLLIGTAEINRTSFSVVELFFKNYLYKCGVLLKK